MQIFGLLSLWNAFACVILGVYIYQRNPEQQINKLTGICLTALSFWTFTDFALIESRSYEEALFWVKVSSLWVLYFSVFIHFMLVLTESYSFLNKRASYFIIYGPVIPFVIIEFIDAEPMKVGWGWTYSYISENPIVFLMIVTWMISATIICEILSWYAYTTTSDHKTRMKIIYIQIAAIIPVILGILSEGILPLFIPMEEIPNLGSLFFGWGAVLGSYAIWKYDLFSSLSPTAKSILSTIDDSIVILDTDLKIISINQATVSMLGFKNSEILNKPFNVLLHSPLDNDRSLHQIQNFIHKNQLKKKTLRDIETTYRHKQGSSIPISLSVTEIRDNEGRLTGVVCLGRDITEWRKTRDRISQELHTIEAKYQEIFENAIEGIFTLTLNRRFALVNPALVEIIGYKSPADLITNVRDIQTEVFINHKRFSDLMELLRTQDIVQGYEVQIKKRSGGKTWVSINIHTITYQDDELIGYEGTMVDISKGKLVKRAKLELEIAERRIEFMRLTSHELKNPLSIISGYTSLLEEQLDLSEEHKRWFQTIEDNILRIENLTKGYHDIMQIEQGIFKLSFKEIEFNEFIKKIIDIYSNLLKGQFEYQFNQEVSVKVRIDDRRINQVFDNMIQNAINHTNDGERKIRVEVAHSDKEIKVKIIDNGAGIPPENLDIIFDLYSSFPSKYSSRGTGLGLYISKAIVEGHGGTIEVCSEGIDKGTVSIITLPIMQ